MQEIIAKQKMFVNKFNASTRSLTPIPISFSLSQSMGFPNLEPPWRMLPLCKTHSGCFFTDMIRCRTPGTAWTQFQVFIYVEIQHSSPIPPPARSQGRPERRPGSDASTRRSRAKRSGGRRNHHRQAGGFAARRGRHTLHLGVRAVRFIFCNWVL